MFGRSCTENYQDTFMNKKFDSLESINDYLRLEHNPSCFEIMDYEKFKRSLGSKYDPFKHGPHVCRSQEERKELKKSKGQVLHKTYVPNLEPVSKSSTGNYIADLIQDDEESPAIVLVKKVSMDEPIVIAMATYETDEIENYCTIHYICKCSDPSLSKSCNGMPRVSALLIYYLAFKAQEQKHVELRIIADGKGGMSLKKYYEKLGFIQTGKTGDDTNMSMMLYDKMIFPRVAGGAKPKDRYVVYKERTYLVLKKGRLNYIRVGKSKSIIYLKDITGEYKWKTT